MWTTPFFFLFPLFCMRLKRVNFERRSRARLRDASMFTNQASRGALTMPSACWPCILIVMEQYIYFRDTPHADGANGPILATRRWSVQQAKLLPAGGFGEYVRSLLSPRMLPRTLLKAVEKWLSSCLTHFDHFAVLDRRKKVVEDHTQSLSRSVFLVNDHILLD